MSRARLRQLEAFQAVMRTGSVTRAAEILGISQPSTTKLLQELEAQTGLSLFERVRKRLHPTAEGRRLAAEVAEIFLKLSQVEHLANELRARGTGELRVACLPALGLAIVPRCLAAFQARHPKLRVALSVVPSQQVVEMLAEGLVDLGFAYAVPGTPTTVRRSSLADLSAVAVLPRGHPLAAKRRLHLADLAGSPFLSLGREDSSRDKLDDILRLSGFSLDVVVETPFAGVICEMVAAGAGVALVDPLTAAIFRNRVVTRPVDPTFSFDLGSMVPVDPGGSPLTQDFLEIVRSAVSSLLD